MVWLIFLFTATAIVIAGTRLSYFGDIIAEKTGLGRTIVGLFFVSLATSLPELITSIRAATLGNPDLVLGNMFGSNLFNLSLIVILDYSLREKSIFSLIGRNDVRVASGGVLLMLILLIPIVVRTLPGGEAIPALFHLGIDSILVFLLYLFFMRYLIFNFENRPREELLQYADKSKIYGWAGFAICAAIIIVAGLFLTQAADEISRLKIGGTPLGGTFVGALFLAIVTSLPELVATLGAARINAWEMALGNIFGSNMFNIFMIFFADLFYIQGTITLKSSAQHLITGLAVCIIVSLVAVHSTPSAKKKHRFGLGALMIVFLFVATQMLLFVTRN